MSPAKTDTILWNNAMAKHLLNRTGFGGRPEEIANFERCGLQASVNSLFNFTPVSPCGTGLAGSGFPSRPRKRVSQSLAAVAADLC
ncbi:MAG: hypothetical protein E2O78_07625 [Caldithrix sp.]|nr:MAG: hypothetical protein E2O78_07625 [Caldithrix sp.]